MSSRPRGSQMGRRAKPGTDNSKKVATESKGQSQGNRSRNTSTTIISAPPAAVPVTLTTPSPPGNDELDPAPVNCENTPEGHTPLCGVDNTASPSDIAVRYSLTPGPNGVDPELEGVQVNIEPDPLGVDTSRHDSRALVLANTDSRLTSSTEGLLKPGPAHEGYSSSEDSTTSPRSAGEDGNQLSILRTGCKTDSSDASSSVAVDCHTGPSEVIVKGKNVRKIHVKFPPHPPANGEDLASFSNAEKQPKSGRFRRTNTVHRSLGSQPQEHGEEIPAAAQGNSNSSSTERLRALPLNVNPILPGIQGMRAPEQQSPGVRDSGISALSLDMHPSASFEWDQKIKHDIINGIEYFERKNAEMKQINNKILAELERVKRINHQIEDRLNLASERNKELSTDNDELKIRLDQREKEQDKLKEQAMNQWQARVKSDEMFMELKRDSDVEIKRLKDMLASKEKEVARVISNASQKEKALRNSMKEPGIANKTLRSNMEDHLELLHKISRLEEEVSKLKDDNDREKVGSKKTKEESDVLKTKLKEHNTELDSQYKRFLSLKKNFNDLRDENEKLKLQLRGRRSMNPNNTWPKNNPSDTTRTVENEAVSYFDIPTKVGKSSSPAGKKLPRPMLEHKRTSSEGRSTISENLPPVAASIK